MNRRTILPALVLLSAIVASHPAVRSCPGPTPAVHVVAADSSKIDTVGSPSSTGADSRGSASGMEAARRFFRYLVERRYDSLKDVAGFPFQWSGRCRIFSGITQLRNEAERNRNEAERDRDRKLVVEWGDVRAVEPGDPLLTKLLFRPLVLPLGVLECNENEGGERDLTALAAHPQRYYTVLMRVDGEEDLIAVRVTRFTDGWRVTGFNN